ncbi:hypothetical protein D3C81_942260 [compost metagenome]
MMVILRMLRCSVDGYWWSPLREGNANVEQRGGGQLCAQCREYAQSAVILRVGIWPVLSVIFARFADF